jgi:hypothetical protein
MRRLYHGVKNLVKVIGHENGCRVPAERDDLPQVFSELRVMPQPRTSTCMPTPPLVRSRDERQLTRELSRQFS